MKYLLEILTPSGIKLKKGISLDSQVSRVDGRLSNQVGLTYVQSRQASNQLGHTYVHSGQASVQPLVLYLLLTL